MTCSSWNGSFFSGQANGCNLTTAMYSRLNFLNYILAWDLIINVLHQIDHYYFGDSLTFSLFFFLISFAQIRLYGQIWAIYICITGRRYRPDINQLSWTHLLIGSQWCSNANLGKHCV